MLEDSRGSWGISHVLSNLGYSFYTITFHLVSMWIKDCFKVYNIHFESL